MRRVALPAAVVALLLVVLMIVASAVARPHAALPAAGQVRVEQVDTATYPEITLYISATDDAGQPRLGLDADDFAITEDGVPVEVSGFGGLGGEAVTSVLVIDRSGSMEEENKIDGAREAAEAFIELMRPEDRAALISFNEDVTRDEGFTGDQGELLEAVGELEADGGTALYDAVVAGVELLRDEPGRRVLLVLSDGRDSSTSDNPLEWYAGSEKTLGDAIAYAAAAGQPVAVVGLGDRDSSDDDGIDERVLQQIADETGGRYFYAPRGDDLAALYTGLAEDVQREYRLTYVSPRPSYDGTRRDIDVSVGGVAAAAGYTERHLINVVSSPAAGIVLLVPLAGLLVLPGILRRRAVRRGSPAAAQAVPPRAEAPIPAAPALVSPTPAPAVPAAAPATILAGPRRCTSCNAPLRVTARFCSRCGAGQGE